MKFKIISRIMFYFFICGIPAMWQERKFFLRAAWLAAIIQTRLDEKEE
jgi:hypothetical protein